MVRFQGFLLEKSQNFSLLMTNIVGKLVEVVSSVKIISKYIQESQKSYKDLQKNLEIFGLILNKHLGFYRP